MTANERSVTKIVTTVLLHKALSNIPAIKIPGNGVFALKLMSSAELFPFKIETQAYNDQLLAPR